jgi:hypothetical protein
MTLCLLELQPVLSHCPAFIRYTCDYGKPVVSRKEEKFYDFKRSLSKRYFTHHKSHTDSRTQLTALRSRQLIDFLSCGKATTSLYYGGCDKKHCVGDHRVL